MGKVSWNKNYSVKIRLIDQEHKGLFDLFETLEAAIERGLESGELGVILTSLKTYVETHFKHEEKLMDQYNYPDATKHKKSHRQLELTVQAIRKVYLDTPYKVDPRLLLKFLSKWLKVHILKEDMKYAKFIHTGCLESAGSDEAVPKNKKIKSDANGMIKIKVAVPLSKIGTIRKCARFLQQDGETAHKIEELTCTVSIMQRSDAEEIVRQIMDRESGFLADIFSADEH